MTRSERENGPVGARATVYDDRTARATVQAIPDLLAAVRLAPGMRLLDVCCGPGYAAGAAAALGASAQGIDFAPEMVRVAQARFPGLDFAEGDAEQLAADDDSFDAAVCNFGLFHVTDPPKAVSEAFRALRAGGRYAFSQWCAPQECAAFSFLLGALRAHADLDRADPAPDAFTLSDRAHACAVLCEAGFVDCDIREVPCMLHVPDTRFFDFSQTFGVRIPLILARQTDEARARIREAVDDAAREYRDGDAIRIPMPSIVVSGRKPEGRA